MQTLLSVAATVESKLYCRVCFIGGRTFGQRLDVLDEFSRISSHYCVGRNAFCYDTGGTDNGIVAYGDTGKDCGSSSNPCVLPIWTGLHVMT